jgi:hypothetical protein
MQKRCAYCRKALEEGKVVKMTILIIHGTQLVPRKNVLLETLWRIRRHGARGLT